MRAVPCWGIHYDILWELWINSIVDQSLTKPHRFVKVIDKSYSCTDRKRKFVNSNMHYSSSSSWCFIEYYVYFKKRN